MVELFSSGVYTVPTMNIASVRLFQRRNRWVAMTFFMVVAFFSAGKPIFAMSGMHDMTSMGMADEGSSLPNGSHVLFPPRGERLSPFDTAPEHQAMICCVSGADVFALPESVSLRWTSFLGFFGWTGEKVFSSSDFIVQNDAPFRGGGGTFLPDCQLE